MRLKNYTLVLISTGLLLPNMRSIRAMVLEIIARGLDVPPIQSSIAHDMADLLLHARRSELA